MVIQIIGNVCRDRIYCAGSFTKLLTTFACLSIFSEQYTISTILDDNDFFDRLCIQSEAKQFLELFQKILGGKFSLHDICSYYVGLPYTFNLSESELNSVEADKPFKHHSIATEQEFLSRCENNIVPVFPIHSKFHYSELCILFLGYFIEKVYNTTMEAIYQKYIIHPFKLRNSVFSRTRVKDVYIQDLSKIYDYPSIAIVDHGYFCYSNGYFTNLNDMQALLTQLLTHPIFTFMTDVSIARAASNRLLNGLTVEMRMTNTDLILGYEGLSYSGCNIWAYSTKTKQGYVTTCDTEEEAYHIIYDQQFKFSEFNKVPDDTQIIYKKFLKKSDTTRIAKSIPTHYQGTYHRVDINGSHLNDNFSVGESFINIRNPDRVKYNIVYSGTRYAVLGADGLPNITVDFYPAKSGNYYMMFDGTLYKKTFNLFNL